MSTEDIDERIRVLRTMIEANPANRASLQNNLAMQFGNRYCRTKQEADNLEAIRLAREAVGATPDKDRNRAIMLYTLSIQLSDRLEYTNDIDTGDEAIKVARESINAVSKNDQNYAQMAYNLGVQLSEMFDRRGDLAELQESISLARKALASTSDRGSDWLMYQNGLAARLNKKHSHTRKIEDLEEAVQVAGEVAMATREEDSSWGSRQTNFATQLGHRYDRTGDLQDLEKAIGLVQNVAESMKDYPDHPDRVLCLRCFGIRLNDRYLRTGKMDDLSKAISVTREAVAGVKQGSGELPTLRSNLGMMLSNRYSRTGMMEDLEEALRLIRQALDAIPVPHPDRVGLQNNLGVLLGKKYGRTKAKQDLEDAIHAARESVDAAPKSHAKRSHLLSNLGLRLGERFLLERRVENLEEAILLCRQAVDTAGTDSDRAGRFGNLRNLLDEKYSCTRLITDREEAIQVSRDALNATSSEDPNRAALLKGIGDQLRNRYLQQEEIDDLLESKRCFQDALNHKTSPVSDRIAAGRQLILSLMITQDLSKDTDDAAEATINLIPFLAASSLRTKDKQFLLSQVVGFASDAAAVALAVGRSPVEALARLETGRGVLASSLQHLRTDISLLQQSHPKLAQSFIDIRDTLDESPQSQLLTNTTKHDAIKDGSSKLLRTNADKRHEANKQMPLLLEEIRAKAGFKRFLLPLSETEMRQAATQGPIIIVNVSFFRCDALIIEHSGIKMVGLNNLTRKDILDRGSSCRSIETLAWLWHIIVNPVFEALGLSTTPSGKSWPHIWWIPTGPLVGFPLHAAGCHLELSTNTVLDRAISSYSSTVKAINHCRQQLIQEMPTKGFNKLVLISMPNTKGKSSLRHATHEATAVDRICKKIGLHPVQPKPFRDNVLSALVDCAVFHFAGHGNSCQGEPLRSYLLLEDWEKKPLTVERMMGTNRLSKPPFLAYLSACRTAQIRDEASADESIHLMAAFQLAGFRHVVGTLWEVDDDQCVSIARLTYESLLENGIRDSSVSSGLHHALRHFRDKWAKEVRDNQRTRDYRQDHIEDIEKGRDVEPETGGEEVDAPPWVPYIHYGV